MKIGTIIANWLVNPMTTAADIIYGGTNGVPTRLANGTAGQVLQSNGTTLAPSWLSINSIVRLSSVNGYGSTNTMIRRFTNTVTNSGSDITYADSATLGASFTINTAGMYSMGFCEQFNAAGNFGISLNSSQLTTSITTITDADRLCLSSTSGADSNGYVGATVYLAVNDVIRPHNQGAVSGSLPARTSFFIARVG